ncbi:DUF11 domain-containing protein [Paenibacillus alvei]|uniref:DUF11 domain-containing protein n=1 Tax=Paenibacillus alvei TaxID=44250 RepID=A0ABT4EDQ0_PAEAL|nr:DUF11 domain-containing protein [Paenibacillus alvei]MCY9531868.1 DUF11 domain-containing protein [Paenibacillus alvei]
MPFILRFSTITRGAITFTGNSLGISRASRFSPACTPGTADAIGSFIINDPNSVCGTVPSSPATGGGTTNMYMINFSTNSLVLPPGSTVVYAELVWGGTYLINTPGGEDLSARLNDPVRFSTPAGMFNIQPETFFNYAVNTEGDLGYVRSANVTALVAAGGAGTYGAGKIVGTLVPDPRTTSFAGWSLGVVYVNPSLPFRSMNLYVGNVPIQAISPPVNEMIGNFQTPSFGPINGRLLVSAQEGDASITGDFVRFGPNLASLTTIPQPAGFTNNFFQSLIYDDNGNINPTATFGDRNPIPGQPGTNIIEGNRQGWDISNVSISNSLVNGQTSAALQFGTNGDGYTVNLLAIQIDNIPPTLLLEKTSFPDTVTVGEEIVYTIVVSNDGDSPLVNTVLTDPLPAGVTFQSVQTTQGSASFAAGTVTVDIGTIPVGQSVTVNITVLATAAGLISNTASAQANQTGIISSTAVNTVNPLPPPILEIEKLDFPPIVAVNSELVYIIFVSNIGGSTATNVVMNDPLPVGTTFVSAESDQGTISFDGTTITNEIGSLAPGETVVIFIVVIPTVTGTVLNTATTFSDETAPQSSTTETLVIEEPILELMISKFAGPDPATVGEELIYTIVVSNETTELLTGVEVVDVLPPGLVFVSAETTQGTVTEAAGTVTALIGDLVPGQSEIITITVIPTAPGIVTNTATATSNQTAPVSSTINTTVNALPPAFLTIEKLAEPNLVTLGNEVIFQVTVCNMGETAATNVVAVDTLPAGVEVTGIQVSEGTFTQVGHTITASFGVIAPGTCAMITIEAITTVTGTLTNTAVVTADNVEDSETATASITVLQPLAISKQASSNPVLVGSLLQYTISVANLGELPLTNVIVRDVIPPTVEFVSVQSEGGTCSVSGQTVTCLLGTLEGQQEQTIIITVIPLLEGVVTNTATAQADNTPPVTATITTLVVRPLECISVSKLFDWVVTRSDFIVEESIPETCRAFVEQAIAGGRQVLVSCNAVPAMGECSITVVKRQPLPIIGSQAAIVLTTCSAEVTITLTDSGTGETCTFTLLVKNNEKVSLCLPLPLDESNITSQIFDIHCAARITDSLTIELQLDWCLELIAKFTIPLMVEATFCQPRALIPIPESCSISLPLQCPTIFPFV